jgi:hypothetical protein
MLVRYLSDPELARLSGQVRGAAYRHYWELSVLYGVQAGLRSGNLWVPGSRRYTDPPGRCSASRFRPS